MDAEGLAEASSGALADASHTAATPSHDAVTSASDASTAAPAIPVELSDAAPPQLPDKDHPASSPPTGSAAVGVGKKTGRPVHPLWVHFHRGEKRNRYHYHAFCVYCVARLGLAQAAATRGVSTDMLRHLEGCAYCPREVVEQVRDMCERRERTAAHSSEQQRALPSTRPRKKAASRSRGGANLATVDADDTGAAMTSLLGGVDLSADGGDDAQGHESTTGFEAGKPDRDGGVETMEQVLQQSMDDSPAPAGGMGSRSGATVAGDHGVAVAMSPSLLGSSQPLQQRGGKRTSGEMLDGSAGFTTPTRKKHRQVRAFDLTSTDDGDQQKPAERSRGSADDGEWVESVLKTVVASNLPLSVLQRPDFLALLQYIHPSTARPDGTRPDIGAMFDDQGIEEAARRLATAQLDRVKEGMRKSTIIKGGLTLSINCWSTLDLQHLVAFSLLNSNGDAACVRVVDMGNHVNAYTSPKLALEIEDVLDQLGREQQISVMGIVADSVVALNAARRVCRAPQWASLLVVPCISAVLSTLAGSIFTHEGFHEAVGDLIDLASYFSNPALLVALREVSGVRDAFIPLPRRDGWYSIVTCLGAVLEYADVITAVCVGSTRAVRGDIGSRDSAGAAGSSPVPQALVELVVADNGVIWKTLRDMERVLAPLREAYSVVTTQHQQPAGHKMKATGCFVSGGGGIQSGLTLAHVMHQFGRISQQYAVMVQANGASDSLTSSPSSLPLSSTALGVAQLMQTLVDTLWRRYDLPVMALAYVFDFHLDASALDFSHPLLRWKAVALYFQRYFHRWFTSDSLPTTSATATQSLSLTSERAAVILNAYQLREFPFDPATTSDYTDVSSFYSFVSDSHPEICALCCRLYALGLGSANVRGIIRGVDVVPPIAQTIEPPATVELLLHIGFASSLKKCLPPAAEDQAASLIHGEASAPAGQELLLCSADEWSSFALEWQRFLDRELAMDEFEQLSHMSSGGEGNGRTDDSGGAERDESTVESLRHLKLSLAQTFVRKLPPLANATFIADTGEDDAGVSVSTSHPSVVLL